ncbi:MAG: SDR family oxidoreductase [Flavobacterium sp.]
MKNIFDLTGKVAVVTGGYGHLGTAMAEGLLLQNATVIVAGRNEDKYLQNFAGNTNPNLSFKTIDIQDAGSITTFFKEVKEQFGSVDVLVNNAHAARGKGQEDMADDDWAYTMDGVLGSVHKCIKAVIPIMKEQQSGKIISVASMYGVVSPDFRMYEGEGCEPYINPPHYGAAKAGIIQLTKYFATYLGKFNIQVNAITPGPFPKETIQADNNFFIERLKAKNPLGKIGRPEDLQGVTVLLSSGASDFITGQNLIVDGGWTIW